MFRSFVLVVFIAWMSGDVFAQQHTRTTGSFRAAVVKVDITPETPQWLRGYNPRQSTGIHDRLYHKIVVLDDGKDQFYLISTDVLGIPVPEYDRVAEILRKQMGIDPLNVWWSATHTHSAPEIATHFKGISFPSMANRAKLAAQHEPDTAYTALFEKKLINGIKEARTKLALARFGVGWGFSQANINRRAIDVDGKASLGLNPDGEVDRRIGIIRIDKEDGTPMAIIANYAMHGTVLGGESTVISGDAPGIAAEYVEEKTGTTAKRSIGVSKIKSIWKWGMIADLVGDFAKHLQWSTPYRNIRIDSKEPDGKSYQMNPRVRCSRILGNVV